MTSSVDIVVPEGTARQAGGGLQRWLWPLAGIAAVIVFELTANLSLSAFVFCLRFGWADFRTVHWISNHDPHRGRRHSLYCFHAAIGALKIVLGGIVVAVLLTALLLSLQNEMGPVKLEAAGTAVMTAAGGLVVALLMTLAGLFAAVDSSTPLWIDRQLHRNVSGFYPPKQFSGVNELGSLIGTLAFLTFLVAFFSLSAVGIKLLTWAGPEFIPLAIAGAAAGAIYAAILIQQCGNRISAESPRDCWPELDYYDV